MLHLAFDSAYTCFEFNLINETGLLQLRLNFLRRLQGCNFLKTHRIWDAFRSCHCSFAWVVLGCEAKILRKSKITKTTTTTATSYFFNNLVKLRRSLNLNSWEEAGIWHNLKFFNNLNMLLCTFDTVPDSVTFRTNLPRWEPNQGLFWWEW